MLKRGLMIGCALVLAWLFPLPSMGAGTTIVVNTTVDGIVTDGLCSLREAIVAANTDADCAGCPGGSGADVIEFDPSLPVPSVFELTNTGANEDGAVTGDLDIDGQLTINGAGSGITIVDGQGADRIFQILPGARITIAGLSIRNGNPGAQADGGGILVDGTGRLTLDDSSIFSNTALSGGGIVVRGLLAATDCSISGNQGGGVSTGGGLLVFRNVQVSGNAGGYAITVSDVGTMTYDGGTVSDNQGGGIRNVAGSRATLTDVLIANNTGGGGIRNHGTSRTRLILSNSTVVSNTATSGAGIYNEGIGAVASIDNASVRHNRATSGGGGVINNGIMDIENSTIDHNQARSGGGIDNLGGNLHVTNSTISHNAAGDNGGGLYNRGPATLRNVTLLSNSATDARTGGNIFNDEAGLAIHNTIVANAGAGGNCVNSSGFVTSLGHNLESSNSCAFTAAGDITNTDPLLAPLADNGGATWTHAPLPGSPVINAGDNTGAPPTDQRGVSRPQGDVCDIGSYEVVLGYSAYLLLVRK